MVNIRPLKAAEFFCRDQTCSNGFRTGRLQRCICQLPQLPETGNLRRNFDASEYVCADIHDIRGSDIADVDIAAASFPCTDVSLAGNRAGLAGPASSALTGFVRVLDEMGKRRPPVVMLENIPGFVTSSKGDDLGWTIRSLNSLGYSCDITILDAKYFVPQSRQRLLIIGSTEIEPSRQKPIQSTVRPRLVIDFIEKHRDSMWQQWPLPDPPNRQTDISTVLERFHHHDDIWWDQVRTNNFIASLSATHAA